MLKEENYHEARLEPYFDLIRLVGPGDDLIAEIQLPRKPIADRSGADGGG